jgi:NAD(P)-dependent dehydrogenase (short-subunit alcohol dehydrogenase family)
VSGNRLALISGASRGIGAAVAERLARDGWNVSLGMRQPIVPDWSTNCVHIQEYDAEKPQAEGQWVEAAMKRFGRIDAVVANAGVMIPKSVINASDEDMQTLMDVNVLAPRRLAKAAWPALMESGQGRVVILASLSGKRVKSSRAGAYAMSKFAAVALAHGLRHEGFDHGIRATAVCPGFVATDMGLSVSDRQADQMTDPKDLARIIAMILDLPNEASVAEFAANCQLEESY